MVNGNILLLTSLVILICVDALKLEQVIVLGRHNIRTPLTDNLESFTTKKWPEWSEKTGHLTPKGALLESAMGEYFSEWLRKEGLLTKACPTKDDVYVYANAPQRTRESARIFTEAAFKDCNVTIHYRKDVETDPVFHPVILNDSEAFKDIMFKDMQDKLDKIDLKDAYLELNRILDLNNSRTCSDESFCDLAEQKDEVYYEIGAEPNVTGPLAVGNSVVDAFLMQYYDGMPLDSVAWGEIDRAKLKLLTKITKENQNVRFNTTSVAKEVAKPLLKVIFELFLSEKPKFTLLVGHDSNINSVITAMGFKPYVLRHQYETTPVGGKLVFQKWYDKENRRYLMKIEYTYQSLDQLRDGTMVSLEKPPKSIVMELANCSIDDNGFCLWQEFVTM